jgi:hypothetical protein
MIRERNMNLPRRLPVDDDDASARRFAHVVRFCAVFGVVLLAFAAGVWQVVVHDRGPETPLAQMTDYVAADAAPTLRNVEPSHDAQEQDAYMTHGG